MNSRVSPFAALTGGEKQIRWLEYQSVTLPYIQGSVEPIADPEEPPAPKRRESTQEASETGLPTPKAIQREPEERQKRALPSPAEFQKTRHSQYDAVIARMKQAEKSANAYQNLG